MSYWRYALYPVSGKKHQLRVHMAALGAPILNDDFYPALADVAPGDYRHPLKLLAQGLAFVDPLVGRAARGSRAGSATREPLRRRVTMRRAFHAILSPKNPSGENHRECTSPCPAPNRAAS